MLTFIRPAISRFIFILVLFSGNAFAATTDLNNKDVDLTDLLLAGIGLLIILAYGIRRTKV